MPKKHSIINLFCLLCMGRHEEIEEMHEFPKGITNFNHSSIMETQHESPTSLPEEQLTPDIIHKLLVCCEDGDLYTFRSLLAEASDEDMPLTLLQLASACSRRDIVLAILNIPSVDINGVDPTTLSTALHIAVCMENEDVVNILLNQRGVNINERNIDGKTPLQLAVERSAVRVVHYFVECKGEYIDWDIVDANSDNIFHVACKYPNIDVLTCLIAAHMKYLSFSSKLFHAKNVNGATCRDILHHKAPERNFASLIVTEMPETEDEIETEEFLYVLKKCNRLLDEAIIAADETDDDKDMNQDNNSVKSNVSYFTVDEHGPLSKSWSPPRSSISKHKDR